MGERRQAVLIIHGIGDQTPMETLRGFVATVWPRNSKTKHEWSRPDSISGSYDLRQIVTVEKLHQAEAGSEPEDIRTDYFELYWAHLMEGTKLVSVWSWIIFDLLLRRGESPKQIRWVKAAVVLVLVIVTAAIVALVASLFFGVWQSWRGIIAEVAIVVLFALLNLTFLTTYIGDAARYLRVKPDNIKARQEIRKLGVDILERLHAKENGYRRILVVGHSLGSMIGYDILTYAFAERSRQILLGDNDAAVARFEEAANALHEAGSRSKRAHAAGLNEFQAAQRELCRSVAAGQGWQVTDFITLGSPLTYAPTLMASGPTDFEKRKRQRELPVCPPPPDTEAANASGMRAFFKAWQDDKQVVRTHHAAVFAFTRWTNLHFSSRWFAFGDIIGGPVAGNFGHGIRDVAVHTRHKFGIRLFSHTAYWRTGKVDGKPTHIEALQDALDIYDKGRAARLPADTRGPRSN